MKQKMTNTKRTATPAKANKPKTHNDYLAAVTEDKRAALQKLRKAIKTASAESRRMHQLSTSSLSAERKISSGLRSWGESLRVLSGFRRAGL